MTESDWIREMAREMGSDALAEAIALQMERPRLCTAEAQHNVTKTIITPRISGIIRQVKEKN